VVASSINLLVLKFLTMNTDDERREEYTRKIHQKNRHETNLSDSDLLNVINGNVLCAFEPTDLNDLKRENSVSFCFSTSSAAGTAAAANASSALAASRNRRFNLKLDKKFPFLKFKNQATNANSLAENTYLEGENCNMLTSGFTNESLNQIETADSKASNARLLFGTQKCPSCLNNMRLANLKNSKKAHYTVRRAPGKISHLLITNRTNSFDLKNIESEKKARKKSIDGGCNELGSISNNANHKETEFISRKSSKKVSMPTGGLSNLTFDINVYIDDDDDVDEEEDADEDHFTATNATTLTNLTDRNNRLDVAIGSLRGTVATPSDGDRSTDNVNLLKVSAASIRNNDLSSQNMTDCDATDGEFFFRPVNNEVQDAARRLDNGSLDDGDDGDFAKSMLSYDEITHVV
jgi:hypothetical protein